MKQKIVIEVDMHCPRCRTKALEIAAVADGVNSVALEGEKQDQVVVIGNDVDTASLVKRLRKKVGCAKIISIEEVKPKPPEQPKKEEPKKEEPKKEEPKPVNYYPIPHYIGHEITGAHPFSFTPTFHQRPEFIYEEPRKHNCPIM